MQRISALGWTVPAWWRPRLFLFLLPKEHFLLLNIDVTRGSGCAISCHLFWGQGSITPIGTLSGGVLAMALVLHSAGRHCVPHIVLSPSWGLVPIPSLNVTLVDFSSVSSIWQFLHCYGYV